MRLLGSICLMAALVVAACASSPEGLKPGASADEIRTQMGAPVASYPLPGGGKRLEFRGSGARTYMLDVDASGRLLQWVQVLNTTNFANIVPGMSKEEVRMTLGQPSDVSFVGRQRNEIWSYHFQNVECLWFQVPFGSDGRTSAGGSRSMIEACMNAASGR